MQYYMFGVWYIVLTLNFIFWAKYKTEIIIPSAHVGTQLQYYIYRTPFMGIFHVKLSCPNQSYYIMQSSNIFFEGKTGRDHPKVDLTCEKPKRQIAIRLLASCNMIVNTSTIHPNQVRIKRKMIRQYSIFQRKETSTTWGFFSWTTSLLDSKDFVNLSEELEY